VCHVLSSILHFAPAVRPCRFRRADEEQVEDRAVTLDAAASCLDTVDAAAVDAPATVKFMDEKCATCLLLLRAGVVAAFVDGGT
jgi:hypothetical protein